MRRQRSKTTKRFPGKTNRRGRAGALGTSWCDLIPPIQIMTAVSGQNGLRTDGYRCQVARRDHLLPEGVVRQGISRCVLPEQRAWFVNDLDLCSACLRLRPENAVTACSRGPLMLDQILETLSPGIFKSAGARVALEAQAVRARFLESFSDDFDQSVERCRWVRTLMSQDKLIELDTIYVAPTLTGSGQFSQQDLSDMLLAGKKVSVTGTAGQGKTSLAKHLVLSLVDNPQGKVPLLLNLRDIEYNPTDEQREDPTSFYRYLYSIFASSARSRRDSMDVFLSGLELGAFVLIFDGLNEVAPERRPRLMREFQLIATRLPRAGCLVTSRPNTGIRSVDGFLPLGLNGMTALQLRTLIKKSPTDDQELKHRFLQEMDNGLLLTHSSFLEVPLLALIMLITFRRYGVISDRMSLFYQQAFNALFIEADAVKGAYIRDKREKVSIQDFAKVFGAFCARTLISYKFNFGYLELSEEIERASQITGVEISVGGFIIDLVESVCLMQKDGLEYYFVHRSFQEYFAAVFLSNLRVVILIVFTPTSYPERRKRCYCRCYGRSTSKLLRRNGYFR